MEDLDLLEIETNVLMDMEDIDVDGIIDEVPMAMIYLNKYSMFLKQKTSH